MMAALLAVRNLTASYGDTVVLHGLSFELAEGGITAILGANGAGKTTTLRALCGLVKRRGEIEFAGRRIDRLVTEDVVRLGVAHVPDGRGTFATMSAEENLRLGAYLRRDRAEAARDSTRSIRCSRASRNAARNRPARCPAANSKCSRSRAR
jgi:branched-chain amino acid transport system ATP-binding protein